MALNPDQERRRRLISHLNAIAQVVRTNHPDLTARQMTVLLKVYLDDEPQTVRGLAKYCNISKPAITRALDRLADEFDFVRRKPDPNDRRSVHVQRTARGHSFVIRDLGSILAQVSEDHIEEP